MAARRWNLQEALDWFRATEPRLRGHRWAAALFGSTLSSGEGEDLDVVCFQWGSSVTTPAEVVLDFRNSDGWKQLDFNNGVYGQGFWMEMPDKRIVDLQFRDSPDLPSHPVDGAILRRRLRLIAERKPLGGIDDPVTIAQRTLDRYHD